MDPSEVESAIFNDRNQHFNPAQTFESFSNALNALSLQFTGQDFSVSPHDLRELEELHGKLISHLDDRFTKLEGMSATRAENLRIFQGIEVVSLGLDCLSRTVPTRWGLKKYARLGALTMPFDLSVHQPLSVESLVTSDFSDYLNPEYLTYLFEHDFCSNTRYGTNFNHETGEQFSSDSFALLRAIYGRRIADFWRTIESGSPICIVYHHPVFMQAQTDHVESLYRAYQFLASRANGPVVLIAFNTHIPTSIAEPPNHLRDCFKWINVPLPREGYVWHQPDHFLSDEGVAYERFIVGEIADAIKSMGG